MRKIKLPKIGEYVLVTHWRDKDPLDPWAVGFVSEIVIRKNEIRYKVEGQSRLYRHCFRISEQEGRAWLEAHLTPRAPDLANVPPHCEHGYNGLCHTCDALRTPPSG